MKYEYDFVELDLTDDQKQMIEMGVIKLEAINAMIRDAINERAQKGWEPLYPFSVPAIWFRKPKVTRRKKTTKKS